MDPYWELMNQTPEGSYLPNGRSSLLDPTGHPSSCPIDPLGAPNIIFPQAASDVFVKEQILQFCSSASELPPREKGEKNKNWKGGFVLIRKDHASTKMEEFPPSRLLKNHPKLGLLSL